MTQPPGPIDVGAGTLEAWPIATPSAARVINVIIVINVISRSPPARC